MEHTEYIFQSCFLLGTREMCSIGAFAGPCITCYTCSLYSPKSWIQTQPSFAVAESYGEEGRSPWRKTRGLCLERPPLAKTGSTVAKQLCYQDTLVLHRHDLDNGPSAKRYVDPRLVDL